MDFYLKGICRDGSSFPRWLSWSHFLSGCHTGDELCSVLAGLLYLSSLVCQCSAFQGPPSALSDSTVVVEDKNAGFGVLAHDVNALGHSWPEVVSASWVLLHGACCLGISCHWRWIWARFVPETDTWAWVPFYKLLISVWWLLEEGSAANDWDERGEHRNSCNRSCLKALLGWVFGQLKYVCTFQARHDTAYFLLCD